MAASGSTTPKNTSTYIQGRIYWAESDVNNENNTSVITAYLQFRRTNTYRSEDTTTTRSTNIMSLTVAGQTVSTKTFTIYGATYVVNQWYTALSKSVTVTHGSDGSKSVSVSASSTTDAGFFANFSGSTTATLTTIPRNSIITSFGKFTIEDGLSFSYTDYIGNKTLSLDCKMGSILIHSAEFTSEVGAHSMDIILSEDELTTIYDNIGADNKSATFKLTLTTSGISSTSTKETTGTLKSNNNKPMVGIPALTEEPTSKVYNAGVGDDEIIRYLSVKTISITATPQHNATISSVKVKNGDSAEVTMTNRSGNLYVATLSNITGATFKITVTDSRGFTNEATKTGTLKQYTRPTVTDIDFNRVSEVRTDGYIRPTGSFWNGTAGTTQNSVTWSYNIVSSSLSGIAATTSAGYWTGDVSLPVDTLLRESAYVCTVTVTDAFNESASMTKGLGTAQLSVWIGKRTVKAEGFVGEHYVGVFPVGAIYMSVDQTNPSAYFGGTWVQIAQGRTLIGVGAIETNTDTTYGSVTAGEINPSVSQRGGEVTHTLTTGEMASHTHTINQIQSSFEATPYGLNAGSGTGFADRVIVRAASTANNESTRSAGSGNAHNNMMPYLAVYIWQRTA